jgi:2,5-furandicarboxylate decarboxylase 1
MDGTNMHGSSQKLDQSYRSFLADLEAQGELIRFQKPVHPTRNMSAVEWKAYSELGKASLFTQIEDHPGWVACSQILADRRKWGIALGCSEDVLLKEISHRIKRPIPSSTVDARDAPVKEVKLIGDEANLLRRRGSGTCRCIASRSWVRARPASP